MINVLLKELSSLRKKPISQCLYDLVERELATGRNQTEYET
jgi:hypothetical protein